MQILMVVWLSILIILATRTANSYNGMSKDCRACVFLQKKTNKKGAELMFDYQWAKEMREGPTKCLCSKENCGGYIEK